MVSKCNTLLCINGTVKNYTRNSCYSRSTQHTINDIMQRCFLYLHAKSVIMWLQTSTGTKPSFETKQNEYRIFLHRALHEGNLSQNPILINDLFHRVHHPKAPYIGVNAAVLLQFLLMQIRQFFCASRKKYFLGGVSNLLSISSFFFFFWACVVCPLSSCLELTLLVDIFLRIWKYFPCLEQAHQEILDRICDATFCMTAIYHTYCTEIHKVAMVFPSPLKNGGLFSDTHINFCYRSGVVARWRIQDPCNKVADKEWTNDIMGQKNYETYMIVGGSFKIFP